MKLFIMFISATFMVILSYHITNGQFPPRINIPGAVLVPQARPAPFRQQRIHGDLGPQTRLRRPPPSPQPTPIRPVVEEEEEEEPTVSTIRSNFEDEISNLGISALQSAVRQAEDDAPRPVHFRPERPVPILRQGIKESPASIPRPVPVQRHQEQRENIPRALVRPEAREELPLPVRQPQPVRHSQRQQIPVQPAPVYRQPVRQQATRQPSQYLDEEGGRPHRARKPPVQILRKYRTDNQDGSITWGYENEDGTFKEETLGVDCVTRGKYGYIDPDGVRREYTYETGNKCDEPEEDDEELTIKQRPQTQPHLQPRNKLPFRPPPPNYSPQ